MATDIQKIVTDTETLKHLELLLCEFEKSIQNPPTGDTVENFFNSKYGMMLRQKSTISYSEMANDSKAKLCERIEKLLPLEFASRNSLNNQIPDMVATAAEEKHDFSQLIITFQGYLENLVSNRFDVYLPNNLFALQGVSEIKVGPVTIVDGMDVSSTLNTKLKEIAKEKPDLPSASSHFDGGKLAVTYCKSGLIRHPPSSPTMWKVSVTAHSQNANEEALWKIKVASGLIRILGQTWEGPKPYGNRLERHPTIFDKHMGDSLLKITDTSVSLGGGNIYFTFELNSILKSEIEDVKSQVIIANIMEHNTKSVGERIYLALAWISTARHTQDKSGKLLATMTALEAIFTRGKDAPVNETIARLGSVVIAKTVEDREAIAKVFKSLYGHRSKTIHSGQRSATETTTATALYVAELVVKRILKEVDLTSRADNFIMELVTASFGSEWPIKP